MTGLFSKKYHIAVLNKDIHIVDKMLGTLKSWYHNKIVVKTYTDSWKLFEEISVNKAKNKPFDLAVVDNKDYPIRMVLRQTSPKMKVLLYKDEESLIKDTAKVISI